MSNYTKTTDFEAKDSLPTGDSGKIIRGAEFETEFDAISTAIATKADTAGPTFTGTATFATISDGTIAVTAFVDEDDMSSNSATLVPTQQSVKAYVDSVTTELEAQDLDFQADSGGALNIDLDTETMTFTGGTGIDTTGSGNDVSFAIDSTVATLTGTQTLTNKTLTSPDVDTPDIDGGTIDGATIATSDITVGTGKTLDVSSGTLTLADDQISGDKVEGGTIASTTITSLASTTVDTTNLEVTNIKAKDGTSAGSIADTTGVVTLASSVLTTADINGGTIDGATIGGTTAAAGSFTTVSATGNITVDGTVDGRDVATDGTKLDGIEALADVTDTTNVTAAGALMDSELTDLTAVKSLDQGVATTDSPTFAGLTTTADVSFGDNDKAIFGAGSDLQIFHNGTDSFIREVGEGGLKIDTNGPDLTLRVNATETALVATSNGAVTAYYDNAAKLATSSTGIDVTGSVVSDGLTVDGDGSFTGSFEISGLSPKIFLSETDTTDVNTRLRNHQGKLQIQTVDNSDANAVARFQINHSTGDISFYEDTGTTAKLEWLASDESLTFADNSKALFGNGSDLQIYHDGSHSYVSDQGTGRLVLNSSGGGVRIEKSPTENMAIFTPDGNCELFYDNSLKLATSSTGIDVTGYTNNDSVTTSDYAFKSQSDSTSASTHSWFRNPNGFIGGIGTNGSDLTFVHSGSANEKLRINSTGIDVTGTVTADGLTVSNLDSSVIKLESTGTGLGAGAVIGDLQFYGNDASTPGAGIKASITATTVAALGDDSQLMFSTSDGTTNNVNRMLIANNGDISFYEDTGTTAKLFWDASAESLAITGPDNTWTLNNTTLYGNRAGQVYIGASDAAGQLGFVSGGTERMRIDSSGNVGIGISSPSRLLTLSGTASPYLALSSNTTGGSPSIFFGDTEDDNEGRITYSNSQDYMSLWTAAAERMRIDSSGNVGIGTSSAGTLHGASYGTTKLHIDGGTDRGQIIVEGDSLASIVLSDNGATADSRVFITQVNDGLLLFKSVLDAGNSKATIMTMTSAGLVGIGTSSPVSELDVAGTTPTLTIKDTQDKSWTSSDTTLGELAFRTSDTSGIGAHNVAFVRAANEVASSTTPSGALSFGVSASNTNATEAMRIDSSGHLIVPNGVTLGTAVGTYAAANTLDDYETGTFTFTLRDATSGGNTSPTTQTALYTKIGKMVRIELQGAVGNIDTTGMTGGNDLYFDLPFAKGSTEGLGPVMLGSFVFPSGYSYFAAEALSGSVGIIRMGGDNVGPRAIRVNEVTSGATDITRLSLTYFT